jgi:hypothetical protein
MRRKRGCLEVNVRRKRIKGKGEGGGGGMEGWRGNKLII